MHLTLSNSNPAKAIFSNESGQAIYKVTTPFRIVGSVSTISRILPSSVPGGPDTEPLRNRWGQLATVEFNTFRSSIITMGGEEMKTSEYLRSEWEIFGW